jgi:hypothetical protein
MNRRTTAMLTGLALMTLGTAALPQPSFAQSNMVGTWKPGVPRYDAFSFKRVDDSTWELTRTRGGKMVQFETGVTSADGKTQTYTSTSFNENGQQSNNVIVFDKQ